MAIDFKRPKPNTPGIELTPLIDVIFQLLIFFMITANISEYAALPLTLPQLGHQASAPSSDVLALSLAANGDLYLNHEPIQSNELAEALIAIMRDKPETTIAFEADAETPYEKILNIFKITHQSGAHRFQFIYKTVSQNAFENH